MNLRDFFGDTPRERLRVKVFADQQKYRNALENDGVVNPNNRDAGGTYVPSNRTVYAWVQFYPDGTRRSLLHECVHQFHSMVRKGSTTTKSNWYAEGLAEYFSMNCWDGNVLKVGAIPDIATEDDPADALQHFNERWKLDLHAQAVDAGPVAFESYADAWALVAFLREHDSQLFDQWSKLLDSGAEPKDAWEATFARQGAELNRVFLAWLKSHQRPWHTPYGAWQRIGPVIEGKAEPDSYGIAVLKKPMERIAARIDLKDASGGLVLNFRADGEYTYILFDRFGNAKVFEAGSGGLKLISTIPAARDPAPPPELALAARIEGDQWVVWLNGTRVYSLARVEGKLGLVAAQGTVCYHDVSWD